MAIIKIVDTEVKETGPRKEYELLPEGAYEVYVDRINDIDTVGDIEKTSIMFRVRDDVEGEHANRTVFTNITTADNMGWKLSNIARAAGVAAGTDFANLTEYANAIAGKPLKIMVGHREYNGKTYTDVKAFYPTRLGAYVSKDVVEDLDII
jgi:hypothetical protein